MGLLDGELASIVADALGDAGLTLPATLTKTTNGIRNPAAIAAGTNPTTQSFAAQGLVANLASFQATGTLISGVDRIVKLFGASIASGAVPIPGDRITIEGATSTIVGDSGGLRAVTRDPARAVYTCQTRS